MEFYLFCHAYQNRVLDQDTIITAIKKIFSISTDSPITFKCHISSFFKWTKKREIVITNKYQRKYQLEDTERLPLAVVLAAGIMGQLEAVLEEFRSLDEVLNGNGAHSP